MSRAVRSCSGISASAGGSVSSETQRLQISRRDGKRNGIADRLVESIVGSTAEEKWLLVVGALIEVVAQLVMHGGEVIGRYLDAHLHAQVVGVVHVPG